MSRLVELLHTLRGSCLYKQHMHKGTKLGLQLLERREKEERWKVIVEGLSHFAALILPTKHQFVSFLLLNKCVQNNSSCIYTPSDIFRFCVVENCQIRVTVPVQSIRSLHWDIPGAASAAEEPLMNWSRDSHFHWCICTLQSVKTAKYYPDWNEPELERERQHLLLHSFF